jgi:branched-chain amino acid transport system substrate-binding protein
MRPGYIRLTAGTVLLLCACLVLLLPTGCATAPPPENAWEMDARAILDHADAQFAKNQFDQAIKTAETFLYRYPDSRHRDRALYRIGEVRFTLRDFAVALNYYKEILREHPSSRLIPVAKYRLGACYFELKDYDAAIADLADRSRITDPAMLRQSAEMLSVAYAAKKDFLLEVKELAYLSENAETDQQKAGYRERVRELLDKSLTEADLRTLVSGQAGPADLAELRLAALLIEQRRYKDAVKIARGFLDKRPGHPEKMRAEMYLSEATVKLTAPRYRLGALLPRTGQLTFFGDRVLKGVELAVHRHNLQRPEGQVELLVKDTEGSADKTVTALAELAAANCVAAVGPLLTKEAEAIAPTLNGVKIPVITPTASGEGIGRLSPWLFRNALTNEAQAAAAAGFALGRKLSRFVIIYPDDAYGRDLMRTFAKELEQKAEVLASIAYPPDVKDFGPYIRKVLETDLRSRQIPIPEDDIERKKMFEEYIPGFDALYLPGYAERVGLLIPQLAYYNINGLAMIGSNNWHSQTLIERAGRHVENAVFTDGFFPESDDPAIKAFVEAYRSAYQEEPDLLSAQAYDAAAMTLNLLGEGKETPQAVRDGLLAMKDFPGVSGATTFSGSGEAQKKFFLITISDGKFAPAPPAK